MPECQRGYDPQGVEGVEGKETGGMLGSRPKCEMAQDEKLAIG